MGGLVYADLVGEECGRRQAVGAEDAASPAWRGTTRSVGGYKDNYDGRVKKKNCAEVTQGKVSFSKISPKSLQV